MERLIGSLAATGRTQIGVGPMSKNCVDAVVELANNLQHHILIVCSRRQIECDEQGGGYVNGWSTESLAAYVRSIDCRRWVVLCRDHGGPWQGAGEVERGLNLEAAMELAKASLRVDILSGFEILHLDPTVDGDGTATTERVLQRIVELHEYCMEIAAQAGRTVYFEVGTDEQGADLGDIESLAQVLERIQRYCRTREYPLPVFAVAQTGTLVRETRNVGCFEDGLHESTPTSPRIRIPLLAATCQKFGMHLKAHNADYLSNEALMWHPRLGIRAANIAPELGVGETRYLLRMCREFSLAREENEFLELAYGSGKWKKWMSAGSRASDREKAIIAGHYVFSRAKFLDVKARIARECARRGIDLDAAIKEHIKSLIMRIMCCFNLIGGPEEPQRRPRVVTAGPHAADTADVGARTRERVSIVIPIRDEEATIGPVLEDIRKVTSELDRYEFETIVVVGGSSDRGADIARASGARVITNPPPHGKGAALRAGFAASTGGIIATMDGDYSHRAEDLRAFLDAMVPGVSLVIGSRIYGESDEYTPVRAFGNMLLTYLFGILLYGRYLSDALNGYKVFRRDVFTRFEYTSVGFEIEIELIVNALRSGGRIVEVPSHERRRAAGKSKLKVVRDGPRVLWRTVYEWARSRRHARSVHG